MSHVCSFVNLMGADGGWLGREDGWRKPDGSTEGGEEEEELVESKLIGC